MNQSLDNEIDGICSVLYLLFIPRDNRKSLQIPWLKVSSFLSKILLFCWSFELNDTTEQQGQMIHSSLQETDWLYASATPQ